MTGSIICKVCHDVPPASCKLATCPNGPWHPESGTTLKQALRKLAAQDDHGPSLPDALIGIVMARWAVFSSFDPRRYIDRQRSEIETAVEARALVLRAKADLEYWLMTSYDDAAAAAQWERLRSPAEVR